MKQIFFILLGFGGIWFGMMFIHKIMLIRREQKFVQQVIDLKNSYLKNFGDLKRKKQKSFRTNGKKQYGCLENYVLKG
jgi:uncharacterized protein YxeA